MLQPVIKWSGSKRSQASRIVAEIKQNYDIYYEPFCGGCSVLFYILNNCPQRFKHFICSDINEHLIELYLTIKDSPEDVFNSYNDMWHTLNADDDIDRKRDYFNSVRAEFNKTHNPLLFFFIMRTTTNGMPRYNKSGEFNNSFHVTRNGMQPNMLRKIIYTWSSLLKKYDVQFVSCSYDNFRGSEKDLMYFDPPYFNTKGMYYGAIDYDRFWEYLNTLVCDYLLSFNGTAGVKNNVVDIPTHLYNKHILVPSGNSSFRRVVGISNDTHVCESLYIKRNQF